MKSSILILNGSLGADTGNTSQVLKHVEKTLAVEADVSTIHLATELGRDLEPDCSRAELSDSLISKLKTADGFVFSTGVYWDSWGSPLQRFLELATSLEASDVWLGKPASCLVTMHSVGGKEVLSRLQGVLSTFGLMIPPMTGFVYSLANHLALQTPTTEFHSDLWQLEDASIVARNLLTAVQLDSSSRPKWEPWPIDESSPMRRWI